MLLCSLVRVKLGCYELEGKNSQSLEEYLKAFMETEVKPLWPKGWMQTRYLSSHLTACSSQSVSKYVSIFILFFLSNRILFKESIITHGHLTGYT